MKKSFGASIAQYAIIISLVSIVIVAGFFIIGRSLSSNFSNFLSIFQENNANIAANKLEDAILTQAVAAGELGGNLEEPKKECVGDKCAIDFGNFVLNGVPDNFGEYIETNGSAGGTDSISNLFEDIAQSLKDQGEEEGYEEFMKLSNLGHLLADIQEAVEVAAKTCNDSSFTVDQSLNCFENSVKRSKSSMELPENLQDVLPGFRENERIERLIKDGLLLGEAMNDKGDLSFANDTEEYPSYAIVKIFDSIMNNPDYSDNLKTITQELYLNMSDISFQQVGNTQAALRNGDTNLKEYDPVTGVNIGMVDFILQDGLNDILNINASNYTDLDSALICTAGKNKDDGKECHKKDK